MRELKKILIVLPSFLNGGTNTCLRSLLPVLKKRGLEMDVFAITNRGPNLINTLKYAKVLDFSGNHIGNSRTDALKGLAAKFVKSLKKILCAMGLDISSIVFKRVATRLEKNDYDLIISFQEGYTTRLCSYFKSTPKIAWVHCDYERYLQASNSKPENKIYSGFFKIVCVSDFTKNQFKKYIYTCHDVVSLHNIMDVEEIRVKAQEPIGDKRFFFDGIRIVSVGRINVVKRFTEIPKIVSRLKELGLNNFKWYIIGDGDEEEKVSLVGKIKKYGASEVVLMGNQDNPYPYIANADLYVLTSSTEACPCVLNEAKILHTPIVSTDFGSVGEFLTDNVNGIVAPINTIAERIFEYLKSPSKYELMNNNIANYRYSNQNIEKKLFKILLDDVN